MSGQHLFTFGMISQIHEALSEQALNGHLEPRVAFVGRSNVGKSSLINSLLGSKLAQVSAEPGKTRLLHFYLWKETQKIVVDLPGYGFATQSKEDRNRWARFIEAYLKLDPKLERVLILLDSRHGPTDKDIEAIEFMIEKAIPVNFVMTKTDQLKTQSDRAKRKKEVNAIMLELGYSPDLIHWVSQKDPESLKKLKGFIKNDQAAPTIMKESR
jgi:GTP-binding protein